jgi:ATP-dependent RNA helicase DeaD
VPEANGVKPTAQGDEVPETADGIAKLFVNRGSRSGISEDDLRWALREGAVLSEDKISSVRVLDRFSFVEIDADQAERTVEFLDGSKLKGSEIRVEVARR